MESEQGTITDLLAIKDKIWYFCIFPHLEFSNLLQLRKVCKQIKDCADGYIRKKFKYNEREINETDASFGDYVQRALPTSKIYINNSGPQIYEDLDMIIFLNLYGSQITHLRVHNFFACVSQPELRFFSALPNLQELELEFTDATKIRCVSCFSKGIHFPPNFRNLKVLKFNQMKVCDPPNFSDHPNAVELCTNLEYLRHPLYQTLAGDEINDAGGALILATKTILNRHQRFPNQPNLKFYDLQHRQHDTSNSFRYTTLVNLCHQHGIKLVNVPAALYRHLSSMELPQMRSQLKAVTSPLMSINNVHGMVFVDELPNLESLVVSSTAQSSFAEAWTVFQRGQPQWPQLKAVDITIDSARMSPYSGFSRRPPPTQHLLNFLFNGNERNNLRELTIQVVEPSPGDDDHPIPRMQDIGRTCGNVSKLSLTYWLGTDEELSPLWGKLPLLEDVTLERCPHLGRLAFMGRLQTPFFNLQRLKKVSLKGLHVMPAINDSVFIRVFRHLKIKQFILQSEQSLITITLAGIESLLTGNFNQHVEKFPFGGWPLNGVSEEQFDQLKSRFRASQIL